MNYSDVLRIPAFRNLWLGQAISQLGDAFYFVIFMFMVKKITGSDTMVGLVGAVDTLPYFLFSVYAGTLADRVDRRKIMLLGDILCGIALLLFALAIYLERRPPVWSIFAVSFFMSSVRVFFFPAKNATIPAVVPANRLMIATALSMATQNVMPMISLSLSATVIAKLYELSEQWFFLSVVLINAVSFLLSAVFVAKLPAVLPDRKDTETHPIEDMRAGFRYIFGRHELKVLLVLQSCFSLLVSPFFVVYMAANDQWFGGKPASLAWFEFAFFVAMVLFSFVVGKLKVQRPGLGFIWGLATVGVCVVIMAFTPYFWPFLLLQFVCGIGVPFADIPISTYLQTSTPDEFRGRVNAVMNMVRAGLMPVGYSMGGLLVSGIGLVGAFLVMGIGMSLATLGGLLDRRFREVRISEEPTPSGNPELAAA